MLQRKKVRFRESCLIIERRSKDEKISIDKGMKEQGRTRKEGRKGRKGRNGRKGRKGGQKEGREEEQRRKEENIDR
jgi:hypothetical protein